MRVLKTRYEKIGIKQVIRLEWMDKTLDMLLAGITADAIRAELKVYLSDKKQSGGTGERGEKTYTIAIGPLMQSWRELHYIRVDSDSGQFARLPSA